MTVELLVCLLLITSANYFKRKNGHNLIYSWHTPSNKLVDYLSARTLCIHSFLPITQHYKCKKYDFSTVNSAIIENMEC